MSILTGKATQPIITPERIDKNRYRAPLFFGAIAVAAAMFSIPMFLTGSTTTALAIIYLAVFIVSYAVSSWCLKYFLSAGRTYWSHDSHQVVMTTPTGMLLFEVGVPLLGVLGVPLAAVAWLLHRQGDWIGSAALAALGALSLPYLLQAFQGFQPVRRRIIVSKSGIADSGQRTQPRDSMEGAPASHWSPSGRRRHRSQEPSRDSLPHRLPAPEHAPAGASPEHLLHRRPAARQALRPRGPQHCPRRSGTHRGRTDRRLLDLEPSVSLRLSGAFPVRSLCARPGSRRCPASWSRG